MHKDAIVSVFPREFAVSLEEEERWVAVFDPDSPLLPAIITHSALSSIAALLLCSLSLNLLREVLFFLADIFPFVLSGICTAKLYTASRFSGNRI